MKTNNILALTTFAIYAAAFGAATDDAPVTKSVQTAEGTLSIQGLFSQREYGAAIQSWNYGDGYAGAIAVITHGGLIAANVAKAVAAQYSAYLYKRSDGTEVRSAMAQLIDDLNQSYTTPIGVSNPYELNVSEIAVMIFRQGTSRGNISIGKGRNVCGEANVVPQVHVHCGTGCDITNSKHFRVSFESGTGSSSPILRWTPKAKK